MTSEKKQEYTRKISQANETELISLVLRITMEYMDDLSNEKINRQGKNRAYENFENCIRHLQSIVNLGEEIGQNLFAIYRFVETEVTKYYVKKERKGLEHSKELFEKLANAMDELSAKDTSKPVMENAERLYMGLTYSDQGLGISSMGSSVNRGYLV